jgi:hypothetical protein
MINFFLFHHFLNKHKQTKPFGFKEHTECVNNPLPKGFFVCRKLFIFREAVLYDKAKGQSGITTKGKTTQ